MEEASASTSVVGRRGVGDAYTRGVGGSTEPLREITPGDRRIIWKPSSVVNGGTHRRIPGDDELVKPAPDDEEPEGSLNLQICWPHRGDGGGLEIPRRWIEGRQISLAERARRRWRSGDEIR
jgi:hypothetical protein